MLDQFYLLQHVRHVLKTVIDKQIMSRKAPINFILKKMPVNVGSERNPRKLDPEESSRIKDFVYEVFN